MILWHLSVDFLAMRDLFPMGLCNVEKESLLTCSTISAFNRKLKKKVIPNYLEHKKGRNCITLVLDSLIVCMLK